MDREDAFGILIVIGAIALCCTPFVLMYRSSQAYELRKAICHSVCDQEGLIYRQTNEESCECWTTNKDARIFKLPAKDGD